MMMWDQWLLGVRAATGSPVILYLLLTTGLVGVATQSRFTACEVMRHVLRLINAMVLGIAVALFAPDYLVMGVVGFAIVVALLVSIHLPLRTLWGRALMARIPAVLSRLVVALLFVGHDVATTPVAILLGVMTAILLIVVAGRGVLALAGRLLPETAFVIAQRVLGAWLAAIGVMTLTFIVMQW